jgi:hypothetical protein
MSTTIDVPFVRTKRGKADAFTGEAPNPPEPSRPWRVAQMLAVAHALQRLLDRGEVAAYGDLAMIVGMTRPRVSQILNLRLLAPDIQEEVLFGMTLHGQERVTERSLRTIVRCPSWNEQRRRWAAVRTA